MAGRLSAQITLSLINALPPNHVVHDVKLSGFGARRQGSSISYFVKIRVHGRQRWITIGRHGQPGPDGTVWSPDNARRQAIRIIGNPSLADKPAPNRQTQLLFADVADEFLNTHGAKHKPRTQEEQRRILRLFLKPALGMIELAAITRSHVEAAHAKWRKTPRSANHALAVLSTLMNWSEERGYRPNDSNPCRGVTRYKQSNRERYLQPDELGRLGTAIDQAATEGSAGPFALAAIRLLILTGARLTEILTLQWSFVDLDRRCLFLPDSKTGKKTIILNDGAVDVLRLLPRLENNPFVIVGHRHGTHLVNLQKPWRRIRALAGIDCRIHDLRHTFASVAVASGGSLPIIGRQLGHSQPQTTQRYAHLADDPVRRMTEVTGNVIMAAMTRGSGQKP